MNNDRVDQLAGINLGLVNSPAQEAGRFQHGDQQELLVVVRLMLSYDVPWPNTDYIARRMLA